jgi:3-phosphoshikimate 1-carboxyvinyltransferase
LDVEATARALVALGGDLIERPDHVEVRGPTRFTNPTAPIHCGNSGTTARLLAGLVGGLGLSATLDGDASLRGRPMRRVVYPLQAMGARMEHIGDPDRLPLQLHPRTSGALRPLRHRPRVASAQVKSALLLAGVTARVSVEVREPGRSRDHTERMLDALGAPVTTASDGDGSRIRLEADGWDGALMPFELEVPGDPSSAAFLIAAALLQHHPILVQGVALNPTRTAFLEILKTMGAGVEQRVHESAVGEPVGEILVEPPSRLTPFVIERRLVPQLIDEIPVLSVLAAHADGQSRIEGAGELRFKESDRLGRIATNLKALGAHCRELAEGLEIDGQDAALIGRVATGGDHRIAMAFGILTTIRRNEIEIDDPECVQVSFPEFWRTLRRIAS